MTIVGDVPAHNDLRNRAQENPSVDAQAPMVNIPEIEVKSGLPRLRVPSVDLGPARNTGLHVMTPGFFHSIYAKVLHQQRPGPDKAHFAFQNVP
jgi:hypothetical protein